MRGNSGILILGVGNLLLGDDGVGVHVVRALKGRFPRTVPVVEAGTAVMDALHLMERAERVLAIDAMQAGGEPGTVYAARACDLEHCAALTSLHEVNLIGALSFLTRQPQIWFLGVEPLSIALSMELSPPVAAAMPEAVRQVERIVRDWQSAGRLMHNSSHAAKRATPGSCAAHRFSA